MARIVLRVLEQMNSPSLRCTTLQFLPADVGGRPRTASTAICCAAVPEQRAMPGRELIILRLQAIPLGFEVRNALRALPVRSARNSYSLTTNLGVGRSNRSGRAIQIKRLQTITV
jgi:hypothetical protein